MPEDFSRSPVDEKIGEKLVRKGQMREQHVQNILKRQRCGDSRLFGEIAVALKYITDSSLTRCLKTKNQQIGWNYKKNRYNIEAP